MMEVDWCGIRKHAYTQGGGLPCTAFTHSGHFIFVSTVMFSDTISTASHLSCCVDPCVCTGHTHMSGWMQRVRERDTNGFSVKLIMDIAFVLFSPSLLTSCYSSAYNSILLQHHSPFACLSPLFPTNNTNMIVMLISVCMVTLYVQWRKLCFSGIIDPANP